MEFEKRPEWTHDRIDKAGQRALVGGALGEVQAAIDDITYLLPVSNPTLKDAIQATADDVRIAHDSLKRLHRIIKGGTK
jgi:hypothetical protein|tara:strand:+ start:567 stop:803 length:237 start_codon:yes stop_codon:yes gene_type:complete